MKPVRISTDFGIVVRQDALARCGVTREQLLAAMEAPPFDENDELLSFGPHFGGDVAEEFGRRLRSFGLEFVGDYFVFEELLPPWCTPYVTLTE